MLIYLKEERLFLNSFPFESGLLEDERKPLKAILDELQSYNLLINHNGGYKIATIDRDVLFALYERDHARIAKTLPRIGRELFYHLFTNRQQIFCRLFVNESTHYEIVCRDAQNALTYYILVYSYEELKALVDFIYVNGLAYTWSLAYDAEDGSPVTVQVSPSPYVRPQERVNEQRPLVAGRLSERALRVARRLQGYNLPD
ncbi:MAG: hypothetical protein IJY15_06575 [Thermoguttaceae bacterium]|nr:hypothetical protein [Thermoguttaceae bacterium]